MKKNITIGLVLITFIFLLISCGENKVVSPDGNQELVIEDNKDSSSSGSAINKAPEMSLPENFVLVEGGTFQMGSISGESHEKPVHSVTVSDFAISEYEVTQSLYKEVMGSNPSSSNKGTGDNYPVNDVSWFDAVKFCNKLSENKGFTPAYTISGITVTWNKNADGYRLPTEAEWEYAARGGQMSKGYTYSGSDTVGNVAWYLVNAGRETHPVGKKQANELGLYDMAGNVYEWCWDWFGNYLNSKQSDPIGYSAGSGRVLRGGSWFFSESFNRVSSRSESFPDHNSFSFGFRLVLPAVF